MRHVKLIVEEDYESGIVGLVPKIYKDWTNYMPSSSFGLAHDLLEHSGKQTGAIDEEFAAHGAYLFVRDFGKHYSGNINTNLATGISRQFTESTIDIRPAPKAYGLSIEDSNRLDAFLSLHSSAVERDWISDYAPSVMYDEDDEAPTCPFSDDETWERICGWIRSGYARAKRRFKNDKGTAYFLFQNIQNVVEKELPSWQITECVNTDVEFTLSMDYESGWVEVRKPYWMD